MNSMRGAVVLKTFALGVLATSLCAALSGAQEAFPPALGPVKPADIRCAIVEWDLSAPVPTLTLVCPPKEVFSPLRVCLRFSWLKQGDVPENITSIVAKPGAVTRIRSDKRDKRKTLVLLSVFETGERKPREKWLAFNSLESIRLVNETQIVRSSGPGNL